MKNNVIYHGNCVKIMKENIEKNSIDLTVTSPPYDDLRDYKGYDFNFEAIAKQLYRVTILGGIVVWVIGDATIDGSETLSSFKQAIFFKEVCGFNLHDTMIFEKTNAVPQTGNRYEQQFEYMFVFSKGKPKTFNPFTKIKKYESSKGAHRWHRGKDGEFQVGKNTKTKYKRLGNLWPYAIGQIAGDKLAHKHPAIFPEELAKDHILSWTNKGDLVLDPMCGSGTTCKMAKVNGRKYIGIDISAEYVGIAKERVGNVRAVKTKIHEFI